MADDDVQLTDLEVIQQFSLAVRGATASRTEVIAALEADLAHLNGGSRRRATAPAGPAAAASPAKLTKAAKTSGGTVPAKAPAKAAKAPLKATRASKA